MRNVIQFPRTKNKKLSDAIAIFSDDTVHFALKEFKKLVDEGCDEAYAFIGAIYEFGGEGVEKDYETAKFYYEKSIEMYGAVEAYLGLVRINYHGGFGVERDCCAALEFCRTVVEEIDHPHAYLYIGRMYMEGCGVDRDLEKAKGYFKKAWDQGYVFGLTYLGFVEQLSGHYVTGWMYRIKAGIIAYRISRDNTTDPRIREP